MISKVNAFQFKGAAASAKALRQEYTFDIQEMPRPVWQTSGETDIKGGPAGMQRM